MKILNDAKLVLNEQKLPLNHLGLILYHSESLEVLCSPDQFFGWDFFCRCVQQRGSNNLSIVSVSSKCILFIKAVEGLGTI